MSLDLTTFPDAVATLACQGQTHTIRWSAGELIANDHSDPDSELALAALGGTSAPCLEVLKAWRRHHRDHRLLTAVTRGAGDWIVADDGNGRSPRASTGRLRRAGARQGTRPMSIIAGSSSGIFASGTSTVWRPVAPGSPPLGDSDGPRSDNERITLLARLGGPISWRLAATVTADLLEAPPGEGGPSGTRPALEASLYGRVKASLTHWSGDPDLDITLTVRQPDEAPSLEAAEGHQMLVGLPLSWVADVWGRGLAVVGEQFALAVREVDPERTVLDAVGTDLRSRRVVTVHVTSA